MKKTAIIILRVLCLVISLLLIAFGVIGFRDHLAHLVIVGVLAAFVVIFWNGFQTGKSREKIPGESPGKTRVWKRARTVLTCLLAIYAVLDLGLMAAQGLAARSAVPAGTAAEELTMLILGTDVDGDQPGGLLKARLDTAVACLTENTEMRVVVSGKGRGEYTEAEVMYAYLVRAGIEEERIYREEQAQSTEENYIFSGEIIRREGLPGTMLVVTNGYHQMRASIYARNCGFQTKPLSAPTPLYLLFPLSERERYLIVTEEWLKLSPDTKTKYQNL